MNLDRKRKLVYIVILSFIYVMSQIQPVLCADCGISQSSTQGFQSWQNHHDLKASLSFTYTLLFAHVTPFHGSGLQQQLSWYCSIKMSRKPLPQRGWGKKKCRNDLVWSRKGGSKCQTAHSQLRRVSKLPVIRQHEESVNHEKDLTQLS